MRGVPREAGGWRGCAPTASRDPGGYLSDDGPEAAAAVLDIYLPVRETT
ncbi:hypothetical protein [Nocardiopsis gilva]|nr:hypothetical protein [Nocardiopsis gilva]